MQWAPGDVGDISRQILMPVMLHIVSVVEALRGT
jgi:hypothetical protein